MSEADYVSFVSMLGQEREIKWGRRLGLALGALVLLAWSYTLLLGIAILVLVAVATFLPRSFPTVSARTYRRSPHLHGPLTYGVDEEKVWIKGDGFSTEAEWKYVQVWREKDPWLILSASGMPPVLLRLDHLHTANVYERILTLTKRHAVEFDSQEAKRAAV